MTSLRVLSCWVAGALLAACAGPSEPPVSSVVRTRPPQAVEQTINNYFAFKIRGSQKNARITVGQPEPSDCALDGYVNSMRGWVVPVAYETRTGEVTGKETITITVKPYYFWFLGNTIAGITPRIDLCPGAQSAFADLTAPIGPAKAAVVPVLAAPATAEAGRKSDAARGDASEARPASAKRSVKKKGKRSAAPARANKTADSGK